MIGRSVISVSGKDSFKFLQGLITSDLPSDLYELSYGALLTAQGKFLFDFLIFSSEKDKFYIDIDDSAKEEFLFRLFAYKLRLKIEIAETNMSVLLSTKKLEAPMSMCDPRNAELGFRTYFDDQLFINKNNYEDLLWGKEAYESVRIKNCVPEFGKELISNETYILEANFVNLSGVSFTKGCFVGQEVTARMRHKTKLRKGLKVIRSINSSSLNVLKYGSPIFSGPREVGKLLSCSDDFAIAYLRFDRIEEPLKCDSLRIEILD